MKTEKEINREDQLLDFIHKQSEEMERLDQHNRSMYIWLYILGVSTCMLSLIIIFK